MKNQCSLYKTKEYAALMYQ